MKTINKQKYIVWVDSIPNHFNNLLDAEIDQIEWNKKGYENIILEKVK